MDVKRLRQIGEWGRASRFVGARWEEVGLERLHAGVAGESPIGLLPVHVDPELPRLLGATGSKNPDVVIAYDEDGAVVLQPADLKWSLDVASYRQISAPVLTHLLEQVPRLGEAVRGVLPPEWHDSAFTTRDGFFFSPKTYANERFLTSPENRRQEYPLEPQEVLFEPVDPYAFFEPLPGWTTARELARSDGSLRGLGQIDSADRYYHLGAGVAGALVARETSIFAEEPGIEPDREVERLRAFWATLRPPSTGAAIERLGTLMRHRHDLVGRLRDLTRASYRFEDFVSDLTAASLADPAAPLRDLRRDWMESYRGLVETEDAEIRQAGRDLVAAGASDAAALESLERQRDAFARRLRQRAASLIRAFPQR
jgi:hypothetical protein